MTAVVAPRHDALVDSHAADRHRPAPDRPEAAGAARSRGYGRHRRWPGVRWSSRP